ncbi:MULTISPECIES: glycosyltransferase family 32 protein [unclassified Roseovarius]|uniref:glycosyltransferase family 32 protein n=1 Tax=unclassified Roseovarius TaxID=2614913 RepID=UPI00273FD957|nr:MULTISPECIES: glycosyltransferase [unclassified Roseovarius]
MRQIEKRIPAREANGSATCVAGSIPAIIHQTFLSTELPDRTYEAAQSWRDHNPECEYRFYDDDDQIALLSDRFDSDVLAAYHKMPRGAHRADLWRYCVLFEHGGVYADIDTVCQSSLKSVLRPDDSFVVPNTGTVPHAVFNAFICSSPGHPILEKAIAYATETILNTRKFEGYMMAGPGALGIAVNLAIGRDAHDPHELGPHEVGSVAYRIIEKCAPNGDQPRRVESDGKTVMLTKYDGYLDDLESAGVTHWAHGKPTGGPVKSALKALKRLIK